MPAKDAPVIEAMKMSSAQYPRAKRDARPTTLPQRHLGATLTPSDLTSLVDVASQAQRAKIPPGGAPSARADDQAGQPEDVDDDTDAGSIASILLRLRIENNSEFVRGNKRAREHIVRYCLEEYDAVQLPGGEYELEVSSSDDDLDRAMRELLGEICIEADDRHCQCEIDARMQGSDRHW